MEYFAGSLFTLLTMLIVARLVKNPINKVKRVKTDFSQSRQHELISDMIPITPRKKLNSQATKHYAQKYIRILFINNNAYWIENSVFYTADFVDGHVLEETKKAVDIMSMDDVELDKMIFIVNKLTEGLSDDSGNSGN
jgi:hypothetical protein